VDVGATTGWILGSCVAAFFLGFSVAVLFEMAVYDFPEATAWWDIDALAGSLAAWTTLMALSATRVRFDAVGVHRRSLFRRREWRWNDVEEIGLRRPRIAMIDEVVSFRVGDAWLETPWAVNAHAGGARSLLELVAPVAAEQGVPVCDPSDDSPLP